VTRWPLVPLSEAAQIVNGGTPKTGVREYWDGGVPWMTPAEMGRRWSPFAGETRRTLSTAGLSNCSARLIPAQSIILSTRAPIGHLVINTVPMAFNQGCRGITPRQGFDTKYLFYFLQANRKLLDDLGVGTTFRELSARALAAVRIPAAPLAEQRRIVAILDEAFTGIVTAIANAEKNQANARELLRAATMSLLQGENWLERPLGSFCAIYQPETISKKQMSEAGQYAVFGANGKIGRYDRFNHEEEQLLVTCRGATCGSINMSEPFSWITGNAMVIRPKDGELRIGLLRRIFQNGFDFDRVITGAAQPQITRQSLAPAKIRYPVDTGEQARLESVMDNLERQAAALQRCHQRKLSLLAELKQSILHRAFNGDLTQAEVLAA